MVTCVVLFHLIFFKELATSGNPLKNTVNGHLFLKSCASDVICKHIFSTNKTSTFLIFKQILYETFIITRGQLRQEKKYFNVIFDAICYAFWRLILISMVNENYAFFPLFYLRNWTKVSTKLTVLFFLKCYEKYYFNKINKILIYALILINEMKVLHIVVCINRSCIHLIV